MRSQTWDSKALIFKSGFLQLPVRACCSCRAAVVPCQPGITASESGEMLGEPFPLGHDPTAQSNFQTTELSSHSSLEKLLPPNPSPKTGLRQQGESPLLSHPLPWHCHQPLGQSSSSQGHQELSLAPGAPSQPLPKGDNRGWSGKTFPAGFGVVFCTHVLGVYTGLERED